MDGRGWIVAGVLTTGLVASAQEPMPLEVPAASTGVVACTPGRCSHRTFLARRRCKRHLQETFIGFPEEFERPPLGAAFYSANKVQVGNGETARMVFSDRDFTPRGDALSDAGRARLGATLGLLPTNFAPVVVERTGDEDLDRRRRDSLLSALNLRTPFAVPPQRVVIGPAIARGLGAEEVEIIRQTRLDRTRARGPALNSLGTDSGGQSPTLPQLERAGPSETEADPQPLPLPTGSTPTPAGPGPR